jgi:hypothetical protein
MNKMEKIGAAQGNFRVVTTGFNPDVAFVSSGAYKLVSVLSAAVLAMIAYLQ